MNEEKTFVRITNKDIFEEIQKLKEVTAKQNELNILKNNNLIEHRNIISRLDQTNGKVKLAKWLGTTALMIALMILGFLIEHMHNSTK